jgi:signal peptidase I
MQHGRVIRNGEKEHETNILACDSVHHAFHAACIFPSPITIPPRHYVVLGENCGASDDSRFWGPVPRTWIVGKVVTKA